MSTKPLTPNRTARTSTAPLQPTLSTESRALIDELTQKHRTAEHTVASLKKQFDGRLAERDELLKHERAAWAAERKDWEDGCDSLQACHRIVHLRTLLLLEDERLSAVQERKAARTERLARLQRDFNLTLFQARETELDARVDELEQRLEDAKNGSEDLIQEVRAKLAGTLDELEEKAELLREAEKARDEAQKETSGLREGQAVLEAKVASANTKVERTTLLLEDTQTARSDLERKYGELQQTNANLKLQNEKWRSLEDKGGAEVESLTAKRIELEARIKELEGKVREAEKQGQAQTRATEKERKKVEKLSKALVELSQRAEEEKQSSQRLAEENEEIEQLRRKAADAEKAEVKIQKQVDQLTAELRELKTMRPVNEVDVVGIEEATAVDTNSRRKPRAKMPRADSSDVQEIAPPPSKAKGKAKAKEDVVDNPPPSAPKKGKRKAEASQEDDTSNAKRRKASKDSIEQDTRSQKPPAKGRGDVKGKKKQAGQAQDKQPDPVPSSDEEVAVPKKMKMRKLNNPFQSTLPSALDWAKFGQGDGSLGIPTDLSPVKAVPQRSFSGKGPSISFRGR